MSFSNEDQTGMACTTSVMIGGCAVTLDINENQLIPGDLPVFPRRVLARMFGIYQQLHKNNLWLGCDGIRVSVLPFNVKVINLEFVFLKALTLDFVAAIHDENIELFRNSRPCYWSNISYENRTVRQVAVTNDTSTNSKVLRVTVTFYGEHLADDRVYGVGPLAFRESLERFVTMEAPARNAEVATPDPQQIVQKITSHLKTKHFGEQQRLATVDIVAVLRREWENLTFSIDHAVHEKFVVTLQSPRMLVVGDHILDRIHRIIKDRGLEREINVHIGTLACLDDSPYTPDNIASENEKVLEAAGITLLSSGRPVKRAVRKLATSNPPPEVSSFVVRVTVKKAHIDGTFVSSQMPVPSSSNNGKTMQQFPINRDPLPDDALTGSETMYSSTRRPNAPGFASPQPKRRRTTAEADSGLVSQKGAYTISSYGRN